jgi:signal transduction histidine kinase
MTSAMDSSEEAWQRRIRELYANVDELYSHVDTTVVVFDRALVEVSASNDAVAKELAPRLVDIARSMMETGEQRRDIPLDNIGRKRVHAFALREVQSIVGVVFVVVDDGARRELFVRSAMAIFDGYRQNEATLLERARAAHAEAQHANRQRDRFLAIAAHELQSPMTSILLWLQILRDVSVEPAVRAQALDAIEDSATGGSLLVADLLDVSRALNAKLHIDREPTLVGRVLQSAIDDARQRANSPQVEVVAHFDPALGHVLGDSRRLRQIFTNLLSNALNSTDEGQVSVTARQNDATITIDVSDTGRGIEPMFLERLFEPFQQADETRSGAGLGLGLTIARELVMLHGGTLSASSQGLGHGAKFTVTFPRAQDAIRPEPKTQVSIAGLHILVVDDDALLLGGLAVILRAAGAVVACARSAAAAYAILEKVHVDVLLSDIGMPGEDGCSLVQRIRAVPMQVPAIAITAGTSLDAKERALAAGFNRYLQKPIDIPMLLTTIVDVLSLPT